MLQYLSMIVGESSTNDEICAILLLFPSGLLWHVLFYTWWRFLQKDFVVTKELFTFGFPRNSELTYNIISFAFFFSRSVSESSSLSTQKVILLFTVRHFHSKSHHVCAQGILSVAHKIDPPGNPSRIRTATTPVLYRNTAAKNRSQGKCMSTIRRISSSSSPKTHPTRTMVLV